MPWCFGSAGNFIFTLAFLFHHLPWVPFCIIIEIRYLVHNFPDRSFNHGKMFYVIFIRKGSSHHQQSYYQTKQNIHKNHSNSFQQFTVFPNKLTVVHAGPDCTQNKLTMATKKPSCKEGFKE